MDITHDGTTDGEGDETVSYVEEVMLRPKRKRSRSKRRQEHTRHNKAGYYDH